jgi:hypothetical protein
MNKVLLDYEQCRCRKIDKEVTITSMVIEEPGASETPELSVKQAFDCNQKEACGVLSILGNERRFDWAGCTHPNLSEASETKSGSTITRSSKTKPDDRTVLAGNSR